MTKFRTILFLVIVIISGCNSDDNRLIISEQQKYTASIINLTTLLTEDENDVSFPTWFNDSIIKSHRITKITRKSFPRNSFEDENLTEVSSTVPREIREYYFDKNGFLIQLNVHNYYDDREIGSVLFSYSGLRDRYGYAQVKRNTFVSKTEKPFSENDDPLDPEVRELDFRMHEKRNNYKKCLVYQDMETGDYSFYITKQKFWGALSVDSMLAPTPKDIIIFGKPNHPTKKYQVTNKVNEKNVRLYTYYKKHPKTLINWIKKEYPFEQKRDFMYNKNGVCNGYIDSTFSEDVYVTRNISEIQYNNKNEPNRIIHRKENLQDETQILTLEVFEYEKTKFSRKKTRK